MPHIWVKLREHSLADGPESPVSATTGVGLAQDYA